MVITPPGFVDDITQQGSDAWSGNLTRRFTDIVASAENFYARIGNTTGAVHLVVDGDQDLAGDAVIDWNAYPTRYRRVIGARRTERLADARAGGVQVGRLVQEEYLEWRIVRDVSGRVVRIEMTTETMDYWSVFAANDSVGALNRIAEFAREPAVDWRDVFGEMNDPFAPDVDREALKQAFQANFEIPRGKLSPLSPYNNGQRALTCMASSFNTLGAAINLAAYGTQPYGPAGEDRPFTGSEMIAAFPTTGAAVDCRNSDPTIFGTAIEQAWEGRKLALRDPAGIYIKDVNFDGILMPGRDDPIPRDWYKLSRGRKIMIGGEPASFHQRLTIEVPAGVGFTLGECRFDDDEPVNNGTKVAALVTIALYFKVSAENAVETTRLRTERIEPAACTDPDDPAYGGIRNTADAIEAALVPTPSEAVDVRGSAES